MPVSFVRCLDTWLRFADLRIHRTAGGLLAKAGIDRHSPGFLVLPALVCAWMIAGAGVMDWRLLYAAIAALAVFGLTLALARKTQDRPIEWDLGIHLLLISLVAALVWFTGGDVYRDDALYRHLFVPLTLLLGVALLIPCFLARWFFSDLMGSTRYPDYLSRTELFQSYGPSRRSTPGRVFVAAVTAPLRGTLQLVWLPAVAALISWPEWLWQFTVPAAIVSFGALMIAGVDDRFDAMWRLLQLGLFRGGALAVSLVVIGLAAARLAAVSYVTTVLDTAAGAVILFLLAGFYFLCWWTDYWIKRLLAQQILQLVAGDATVDADIDYPIGEPHTSVPATRRVLQIHGASRFLAFRPNPAGDPWFQTHTADSMIEMIADAGAPGGKAIPLPSQIRTRSQACMALTATFLIVGGWLSIRAIQNGPQSAELGASVKKAGVVDLKTLLLDDERRQDGRPSILIAASGGGTRAALFTECVLRALWKQNAARDVVLGSGISGGGAALAYFASKRPQLIAPQNDKGWTDYMETMKQPFIQDVLAKSTEWRIVGPGRLGMLLSDSFINRWHLDPRGTLGDVSDFGLILNTSLTGHFDCQDAKQGTCGDPLSQLESRNPKAARSELAGGRLILTNVLGDKPFTPPDPEGQTSHPLPVVVNDPAIRLETAAALNANFPPVFSDAAVDVDARTRFWVTDGGAVDNRGMETLLYALRARLTGREITPLPRIIVLIADASGLSPEFTQDRGTAAALSAGSKLASQLSAELIASIQRTYCAAKQPDDFGFAYLFMPDEMRNSNSFGTHWMLQPYIRVKHRTAQGDETEVTLTGDEMARILQFLYTDESAPDLSSSAAQVLAWGRAAASPWKELVAGLRNGGKLPGSGNEACKEAEK